MNYQERLKEKKRVVIKILDFSLTHPQTGRLNLRKLGVLGKREQDLRNQGARMWYWYPSRSHCSGRAALGFKEKPSGVPPEAGVQLWDRPGDDDLPEAVRRVTQMAGQILMTKNTMMKQCQP